MMKSFFKKLAFVMALAMVVSMAAPAGSALAAGLSVAYQAGGAVSELNLKAGAEQDLKFLGAPKNWKDLGWSWTSSNEAVATVDAAGVVTAVADGTATITITVGTLSGSVTVNVGDAKAYDVTLGTADNKAMTALELKKDGKFDFNFYGVKDWNKNNYTVAWSVSGDAANVDKNGVVTAVKAGKAVVTASIVNNVTGVAHKVTPVEVTVAADVNKDAFTVAQKDTDKFVLTFDVAKTAEEIRDGLTVSVKIGDKDYPISFENIAVDGKNVTVTTYAQFENEEVYTLAYGKETVAHTIVLGDIASVSVDYYTGKNKDNKVAYVTEEEESDYVTLVPVLYDQYGNDITDKYNLANFDFIYEVSDNVSPVCIYNDVFAFDAAGLATVDVTASWITDAGELKEATGKTTFVVEKRGNISLTLQKAGIGTSCNWLAADDLYTYEGDPATDFRMDPNSSVWNAWGGWFVKTSFDYQTNDGRKPIYTAVFKDNRGNLVTSNNPFYTFGTFSYESTNTNILTIEDGSGSVAFNGVGKANILVYFEPADGSGNKKLVASTTITVTPEVYPVTYKLLSTSQTTASDVVYYELTGEKFDWDTEEYVDTAWNLNDGLNDVTFKVQFYDQFGAVYEGRTDEIAAALKLEARDASNTVFGKGDVKNLTWNGNSKTYNITFDGSDFDLAGNNYKSYGYKVSLEDVDVASTVKTPYTVFSLTVKDTSKEVETLDAFLNKNKLDDNYKFNISLGGSQSVDVAVKNVIDYSNTYAQGLFKDAWNTRFSAKYLSSGNLAIAHVPSEKLVDNTNNKLTTGSMGYVYYKVSAPTKTTVAGASVNNNGWDSYQGHGEVAFTFNDATAKLTGTKYMFVDADGKKYEGFKNGVGADQIVNWGTQPSMDDVICVDCNGYGWNTTIVANKTGYDYVKADDLVEDGVYYIHKSEDNRVPVLYYTDNSYDYEDFQYAGNGNYSVAFSTTRTEGGKLYTVKNSSITISNSQNQIKYVGLNPDFDGVTEKNIVARPTNEKSETYAEDLAAYLTTMQEIIEEQLLFSYEEMLFGDYYYVDVNTDLDAWTWCASDVKILYDDVNTKISVNNDGKSVTITSLVFEITLDDGNSKTTTTHKMKVNVGVRIKEK